jgi:hypothetical protein
MAKYLSCVHFVMLIIWSADSEPAYFYYRSTVEDEIHYLVAEALPDWKHKAARFKQECVYVGIPLDPAAARSEAGAELAKWFSALKDEVQEWEQRMKGLEIPSFEQAVADLEAMKATQKELEATRTLPATEKSGRAWERLRRSTLELTSQASPIHRTSRK